MPRRTGSLEHALRRHLKAYLQRHGYGSATAVAKQIRRPPTWLKRFVDGERHASFDECVALLSAIGLDIATLVQAPAAAPAPVDDREPLILRLFHRMNERQKRVTLDLMRTVLRHDEDADRADDRAPVVRPVRRPSVARGVGSLASPGRPAAGPSR